MKHPWTTKLLLILEPKTDLFINIYNWQVSYPQEIIYLALANITACFHFPRILADVVGAFGFVAEGKYFVSPSHVFGSNTSGSSWEAFRRAIPKNDHCAFAKKWFGRQTQGSPWQATLDWQESGLPWARSSIPMQSQPRDHTQKRRPFLQW